MLNLSSLEGKWFIIMTNFPMWLKGDRYIPSFNYKVGKKGGEIGLFDQVKFIKNKKERTIKGFDSVLDSSGHKFEWRGFGILALFKSRWEVVYVHEDQLWILIKFQKTWLSPAGYDVISKSQNLSSTSLGNIKIKLDDLGINENLTFLNTQNPST